MKLNFLSATFVASAVLATGSALAVVPSDFLGEIDVAHTAGEIALPIAADSNGRIYFGQFNSTGFAADVSVYVIDDPAAAIGQLTPQGTAILNVNFPTGRGIQGLAVTADRTVYISGDPGGAPAIPAFIRKYTYNGSVWTEDAAFSANTVLNANRHGGLALVGNDLLVTSTFNSINYFNASTGAAAGLTNVSFGGLNYHREPLFNSVDNVVYPLRNGNNTAEIIAGYVSGVSLTTGGGTWNLGTLIADGAVNSAFGTGTSHGYYHAASNRVYTVNTAVGDGNIRIWDVSNSGATLTLAGTILPTLGPPTNPWALGSDVVVSGDNLYLTASTNRIYVYGTAPVAPAAADESWNKYE